MRSLLRYGILLIFLCAALIIAGCGGDTDADLVRLDLDNLGRLTGDFTYAAWVQSGERVGFLDTFNTGLDNTALFSRFALIGELGPGDRVFITLESPATPRPQTPSNRVVLTGIIQGGTAILTFPRMQDFANAAGFATVSADRRQLFTEFVNLPDISDLNFIYQGFLQVGNNFIPLTRFNANQTPVSDTVTFDLTTARYILSVEPVPDPDPSRPYTIQPLFTNGPLVELLRQPLARSSLTPNTPNFRFPSGVATIR